MTLQVVVDTNLIVSAFLWGGLAEKLISELLARGIPMLTPSQNKPPTLASTT